MNGYGLYIQEKAWVSAPIFKLLLGWFECFSAHSIKQKLEVIAFFKECSVLYILLDRRMDSSSAIAKCLFKLYQILETGENTKYSFLFDVFIKR